MIVHKKSMNMVNRQSHNADSDIDPNAETKFWVDLNLSFATTSISLLCICSTRCPINCRNVRPGNMKEAWARPNSHWSQLIGHAVVSTRDDGILIQHQLCYRISKISEPSAQQQLQKQQQQSLEPRKRIPRQLLLERIKKVPTIKKLRRRKRVKRRLSQ